MRKEADASLGWRFALGVLITVTASAVISASGTVIQLGKDWTRLTTTVQGLAKSLDEKTADRWTRTDHEAYVRSQDAREVEQDRRIQENRDEIKELRNRR